MLLSGTLFVTSCEKAQPDSQSAEDDARGSYIMADAFAVGNNEAGGGGGKNMIECMTVVRNETTNPKTLSITFDNCSYQGALRNGTINVSYSYIEEGTRAVSVTISFDNYTINSVAVSGTISSTFSGTIPHPVINVTGDNMLLTFPDSKTISFDADLTFDFVNGLGDGLLNNVVYEVSGTFDGVNRDGKSYQSTYSDVRFEGSCESGYPVSGNVTIDSENGETGIDFGNGTCDKIITVSKGKVSINITLN